LLLLNNLSPRAPPASTADVAHVPPLLAAYAQTLRKEKREPTEAERALIDEVEAAREIIIQVSGGQMTRHAFATVGGVVSVRLSWNRTHS
jgi:hypothetical protein